MKITSDVKSKSDEGQKKVNRDHKVNKKAALSDFAEEKDKQSQQQQNSRQMYILPASNKPYKKKTQQQGEKQEKHEKNEKHDKHEKRDKHDKHVKQEKHEKYEKNDYSKKKGTEKKFKPNAKTVKDKKENKNKGNKKPVKQFNVFKSTGNFIKTVLEVNLIIALFTMASLWYLYIVDIERFQLTKNLAAKVVNSMVQVLPRQLVTTGFEAMEYIRAAVEGAVVKLLVLVDQTSTVLSTNPERSPEQH